MGEENKNTKLFYAPIDGGEMKELYIVAGLDIGRETIEENSPDYYDNTCEGTISFDVKMTPSFEKFLEFHKKMLDTGNRIVRFMNHKKLRVRKKNKNRFRRFMKKYKISEIKFELAE